MYLLLFQNAKHCFKNNSFRGKERRQTNCCPRRYRQRDGSGSLSDSGNHSRFEPVRGQARHVCHLQFLLFSKQLLVLPTFGKRRFTSEWLSSSHRAHTARVRWVRDLNPALPITGYHTAFVFNKQSSRPFLQRTCPLIPES